MKKYYISLIIKIAIAVCLIAGDLLCKYLLQNHFLAGGQDIVLINGIISITYVENLGAAFGMMSGNLWFLIIFTFVFLGVFVYLEVSCKSRNPWYIAGFSMIFGGAIANLYDRITFGFVRDFFRFDFINFAVFNLADVFLVAGVICTMIYILFYEMKNTKEKGK